jgi:hypothetical protein
MEETKADDTNSFLTSVKVKGRHVLSRAKVGGEEGGGGGGGGVGPGEGGLPPPPPGLNLLRLLTSTSQPFSYNLICSRHAPCHLASERKP